MTAHPLARIEELFHRAADLAVPERDAFLTAACGDDRELRAAVEELLRHDDAAGRATVGPASPIERTTGDTRVTDAVRHVGLPRDAVAGYEILEEIGSGGMGVV